VKVKQLIPYDKDTFKRYSENNLGGWGGWFNAHYIHDKDKVGKEPDHTWEDYLNELPDDAKPYAIALKEYIVENGIKHCAPWHQSIGVPLFEDNTYSTFSYRAWGDLMAAIYTTPEKPLTYMEFYM